MLTADMTRRQFLAAAAAAPWLANYRAMAAVETGRHKIRSLDVMVIQGPDRNYTHVRVNTDTGLHGIGEGYGSPGAGVKEQMLALEPLLVGKDPLEIEKIYVGLTRHTDGSAHMFMRGVSGIEMALWDLAGKILNVPVTTLLGGAYRDKVRMYNHGGPSNPLDKSSCRDWAAQRREDPRGFNCVKFSPERTTPATDIAHDPANRVLTNTELRNIRQGFENCREALGWEHDIIVHCHWEYDLRTAIQLAEAIEPIMPLYLEDPLPVEYNESWRRLCDASRVAIGKGENLARRQGFEPWIVNAAIDVLNPDLRNTGGLLETKKIADMAEVYYIPFYNHNTGATVCTWATVQWAAAIRDYIACETVVNRYAFMEELLVLDEPLFQDGFIKLPNKPGLGIELNPDVAKAHLADGEVWWG
jgi:L-alanine-DL-glutamate epimerase-like enolase superfamily enzyme